jgi:YgiT-type zinc finger domain-containing protein
MHRTFLTYFTWLGDELITVPDFPAWVCDVCGKREFDVHALNQLSLLLSPTAGKPPAKVHHSPAHTKPKHARPSKAE